MARNEVKWGAILSYVLIALNSVYGLVIMPFILGAIGESEYGVYKTISSLSSSLMILDLGLGSTVMRYIAKFKSDNKNEKIESFISMALGEGLVICAIFATVSSIVYTLIPDIYANGLSSQEIILAEKLFLILAVNMVFHIIENIFNGIISGHNNFTFANSLKLLRIILRISLVLLILSFKKNAIVLVLIDLLLTLIQIVTEFLYVKTKLNVKVKLSFRNWDKAIFIESFKYTFLLFITTIAAQINNNLDNVVIGAIQGSAPVAIYSIGLLIFGMFEQLSTSISGVMLPTVTNIIRNDTDGINIQKTIIQIGRIQFMLLGAAFVGFIILGKSLINLWVGEGFEDVYIITLILMGPALLELCVNVCLSVLRAKNMLGFRTGVLFATTVLNAVITVIGVKLFGYYAAAVGTACSFLIGSVIIMNIYYYKKLSFKMIKIYKQIFSGTWICLLLSGGAILISSRFLTNGWLDFVLNIIIFGIVYAITMMIFGLRKEEKKMIPYIGNYIN